MLDKLPTQDRDCTQRQQTQGSGQGELFDEGHGGFQTVQSVLHRRKVQTLTMISPPGLRKPPFEMQSAGNTFSAEVARVSSPIRTEPILRVMSGLPVARQELCFRIASQATTFLPIHSFVWIFRAIPIRVGQSMLAACSRAARTPS